MGGSLTGKSLFIAGSFLCFQGIFQKWVRPCAGIRTQNTYFATIKNKKGKFCFVALDTKMGSLVRQHRNSKFQSYILISSGATLLSPICTLTTSYLKICNY